MAGSSMVGRRGNRWGVRAAANALALLLPALPFAVQAQQTLRVGAYNNPPKILIDDAGQLSGILGELLQEIAARESWRLVTVPCDWQACLMLLQRGEIDLLPDVAPTPERGENMAFHREPALHSWSQIYRRADVDVESILDLANQRIAILSGSVQLGYLEELLSGFGITPRFGEVADYEQGFAAVRDGLADVVVVNRYMGDWHAAEYGLRPTPLMFQATPLFYAAPLGSLQPQLDTIDRYLTTWKDRPGSPYYRILERWNQPSLDRFRVPVSAWLGLALLALTLLFALRRMRRLRLHVDERTAALASSEQRLADIMNHLEAYVFIKSHDLKYMWANEKVARFFGLTIAELIGRTDAELFDAPTAARLARIDLRVLKQGETVTEEEVNRRPDSGHTYVFLSVKTPIRDSAGNIQSMLGVSTDITDYRAVLERNHQLVYFDSLTGLPNRRHLLDRLSAALQAMHSHPQSLALLLIDIDQFRRINDLESHAAGDEVLTRMAVRLRSLASEHGLVAHLGSDEFVLLLTELPVAFDEAAARVEMQAQRLHQSLCADGALVDGRSLSVSIGVVVVNDSGVDAHQLLQEADIALGEIKAAGGRAIGFFNADMQRAARERLLLEQALDAALLLEQFRLHFQPVVDNRGQWVGMEALVRWEHPERGLMTPDDFIPLAERSGQILPLGTWVLNEACRQLAEWSSSPSRFAWTLAVNVSALQFHQSDFVLQVQRALSATAARPERLVLEITESALLQEPDSIRSKLMQLQTLGVGLSLDDFGTGYSSLSYLKRLPLQTLKIDRSFTRGLPDDPADCAIITTILTLARTLGLQVVAEGVETPAQQAWLCEQGCDFYQGFLYGRPATLNNLVRRHTG